MKAEVKKAMIAGAIAVGISFGFAVLASTMTQVKWDGIAFWCVLASGFTLLAGGITLGYALIEYLD